MKIQTSNSFIHICLNLHSERRKFWFWQNKPLISYFDETIVYYDRIHLYGKNLEQEKYKHMIKEFNDFSNEVGYDITYYSNDEVTPVTSIDPDSQTIVIFDDFVCEKKN